MPAQTPLTPVSQRQDSEQRGQNAEGWRVQSPGQV